MFQVRIHGRGGQGVVSGAEMLSVAAFLEGRHAQAFPSFGSERMGAPVMAFCRIDDKAIRLREPIMQPDALIIQDPTLLHQVDVFQGLKADGYVLINSGKSFEQLGIGEVAKKLRADRQVCVPATEIALNVEDVDRIASDFVDASENQAQEAQRLVKLSADLYELARTEGGGTGS